MNLEGLNIHIQNINYDHNNNNNARCRWTCNCTLFLSCDVCSIGHHTSSLCSLRVEYLKIWLANITKFPLKINMTTRNFTLQILLVDLF